MALELRFFQKKGKGSGVQFEASADLVVQGSRKRAISTAGSDRAITEWETIGVNLSTLGCGMGYINNLGIRDGKFEKS